MTHVWPESVSIPLVTTQVIVQLRSGIGGNEYIQPLVQPRASCSGFLMKPPERHQRGLRPVEASCSCFPMKHLEPA